MPSEAPPGAKEGLMHYASRCALRRTGPPKLRQERRRVCLSRGREAGCPPKLRQERRKGLCTMLRAARFAGQVLRSSARSEGGFASLEGAKQDALRSSARSEGRAYALCFALRALQDRSSEAPPGAKEGLPL